MKIDDRSLQKEVRAAPDTDGGRMRASLRLNPPAVSVANTYRLPEVSAAGPLPATTDGRP